MVKFTDFFQSLFAVKERDDVAAMVAIHGVLVVYAASFWLTQPILPYLSQELGADTVTFGYLQTLFSFVQVIGSAVIGRISDAFGNRIALLVALFGSGCSYFLMGYSYSLTFLFLSRLPTVTMHAMQACQAFVTALSSTSDRAKALGRLSLSYGIGMILGSALGGSLSNVLGYHGVATLAGMLSFATLPVILWFIPRDLGLSSRRVVDPDAGKMNLDGMKKTLKEKHTGSVLQYMAVMSLCMSMYQNSTTMFLKDHYEIDAQTFGFIQSFGAIISAFTNVVGIGYLTKKFSEFDLLRNCAAVVFFVFSILGFFDDAMIFFTLFVPFTISGVVMYTVTTSLVTKACDEENQASVIGLSHSTRSISGIVAPLLGNYLLQYYGFPAVCLAGGLCTFAAYRKACKFERIFEDRNIDAENIKSPEQAK